MPISYEAVAVCALLMKYLSWTAGHVRHIRKYQGSRVDPVKTVASQAPATMAELVGSLQGLGGRGILTCIHPRDGQKASENNKRELTDAGLFIIFRVGTESPTAMS